MNNGKEILFELDLVADGWVSVDYKAQYLALLTLFTRIYFIIQ